MYFYNNIHLLSNKILFPIETINFIYLMMSDVQFESSKISNQWCGYFLLL